jgi:hypothetical protein
MIVVGWVSIKLLLKLELGRGSQDVVIWGSIV